MPIYWAFLTYMLLRPGVETTEYTFIFPGFDKIVHFFIFLLLGILFRLSFGKIKFHTYIYSIMIYAVMTEILQDEMKLGRSGEFLDMVADFFGVMSAWFILNSIKSRLKF